MRKTVTAVGLLVTAALLTGCGNDGTNGNVKPGNDDAVAEASKSPSSTAAETQDATREVTLEVEGQGTTSVMYNAASSGFEQQTLPWKKTETVELTAAEQKVGYLVSVVPGSIQAADGTLQQAPCVIKVDGKQVADNDGVKNPKGCSYKIK
ncbi:C-terminal processing protease CtpA/Prc [Streptomyces sp. V4I23]|uniref:hypothetical protein n=1 Tax=Streptomyces sp. V4I23 TaxID=3042282 RepID=UPI0027809814|nr:hypothetical protein [Streptomyces sp. V4I23]MDQ1009545.1 C-terminal processing protease CtpA/Prc [Streptomyces sp. V4I23]